MKCVSTVIDRQCSSIVEVTHKHHVVLLVTILAQNAPPSLFPPKKKTHVTKNWAQKKECLAANSTFIPLLQFSNKKIDTFKRYKAHRACRDFGKRRDKRNSTAHSELVVRVTTSGSRPPYKSPLPLVPTHRLAVTCRVAHFQLVASKHCCRVSDRSSLLPALLAHAKLSSYAFRIAHQNRSIWLAC